MSELGLRVISGVVMAAVFLLGILFGGWIFAALIGTMSCIIWTEWIEIKISDGDDRVKMCGYAALAVMVLALLFISGLPLFLVLVSTFAIAAGFLLSWTGGTRGVIGLLYAAGFLIAMVMLRGNHDNVPGLIAIFYLCATVWFTDIGAYFIGKAVGGPKLAPAISPKKTISGAIGGIIVAALGAFLVIVIANLQYQGGLLLLAIFLSAISQIGDLYESWLKRRAGVKDSGHMLPGHGGMMDRVDGLLFAAIALWIFTIMINGFVNPASALFV